MKLKEILEYYERYIDMLLEASAYEDMFSEPLLAALKKHFGDAATKEVINKHINDAKKRLKRKDRIIWYIRIYKLTWLKNLAKNVDNTPAITQLISKELKKYNAKAGTSYSAANIKSFPNAEELLVNLEHFFSMEVLMIDRFEFKYQPFNEVIQQFSEWETEHIAKKSKDRLISEKKETVFLDVGDGWVWFNLNRPFCNIEGGAMGHCGNAPDAKDANQTILSLRKKIEKDGKSFWQPHATFIYFKRQQKLGQRKGILNNKPHGSVNPQIMALLKDPRIKGFNKPTSTHHAAHNDFSLEDLTDEERDEVLSINDTYNSISLRIKKEGISERILVELDNMDDTERTTLIKSLPIEIREEIATHRPKFMLLTDRLNKYGATDAAIESLNQMSRTERDDILHSIEPEIATQFLKKEPDFMKFQDRLKKFGVTNSIMDELAELDEDEVIEKLLNVADEKHLKTILRMNKNYNTFQLRLARYGLSDEIFEEIEKFADIDEKNKEYPVIVKKYTDLNEVIEELGNDTAKYIKTYLLDGEFIELDWVNDQETFDDKLSLDDVQTLREYVVKFYSGEIDDDEFLENGDWYDILNGESLTWFQEFLRLPEESYQSGIQNEMGTALEEAIADGFSESAYDEDFNFMLIQKGETIWNSKFTLNVSAENLKNYQPYYETENAQEFMEYFSDAAVEDLPTIKVDDPYYGWSDFDDAFFKSEVDDFMKMLEKSMEKNKIEA